MAVGAVPSKSLPTYSWPEYSLPVVDSDITAPFTRVDSFTTEILKSSSKLRLLVEIDFGQTNTQWINMGAGIWMVNYDATYDHVDASLLAGFTAQDFGIIGSVKVSGRNLTKVDTLAELTGDDGTYYWDQDKTLYICNYDFDEPYIHIMTIGLLTGFSEFGFSPPNGPGYYEGRLNKMPKFSQRRDPLFYGRISFGGVTVQLLNGDGSLDGWGASTDIYGQDARVLMGFEDLDYSEYVQIYSGFIQTVDVSESQVTLRVEDKRRQLSKAITYSCTDKNALDAIRDILLTEYGYGYNSSYYDLTAWAAAHAEVENVTIDMQEPEPAIDVIEDIAASVFGIFSVNAEGLFSFKVVDEEDSIDRMIDHPDIMNAHAISYDPTQVLSSIRVGYAKDWATTGTAYTYLTDTSREDEVFALYKTYTQRTFDTLLPDLTAAQSFATRVLDYSERVRGVESITVPIENYDLTLGTQIGVVVQRGEQPMLGEMKAEVTGIDFAPDIPGVNLTIRHGGAVESFLTHEDGNLISYWDCEDADNPPQLDGNSTNAITVSRSADEAYEGTYSYKVNKDVAAGTGAFYRLTDNGLTNDMHGLVAGVTYTFTVRMKIPSGGLIGTSARLYIYDYQGAWEGTFTAGALIYDKWQSVTVTRTIRGSATGAQIRFEYVTGAALNDYFHVDNVQFYAGTPTVGINSIIVTEAGSLLMEE